MPFKHLPGHEIPHPIHHGLAAHGDACLAICFDICLQAALFLLEISHLPVFCGCVQTDHPEVWARTLPRSAAVSSSAHLGIDIDIARHLPEDSSAILVVLEVLVGMQRHALSRGRVKDDALDIAIIELVCFFPTILFLICSHTKLGGATFGAVLEPNLSPCHLPYLDPFALQSFCDVIDR